MSSASSLLLVVVLATSALCSFSVGGISLKPFREIPLRQESMPSSSEKPLAAGGEGISARVEINPVNNLLIGTVKVGWPGQELDVAFSLASSDFWVLDSRSLFSLQCDAFNASQSVVNSPQAMSFVSESVNGWEAQGSVSLDYVQIAPNLITAASIIQIDRLNGSSLLATVLSPWQPISGVVGLAWPSFANENVSFPLLPMALSGLGSKLFTLHLNPNPLKRHGTLTFGAVDKQNCELNWQTTKWIGDTYWQFQIDSIFVEIGASGQRSGVQQLQASLGAPTPKRALLLEQTSFIHGPPEHIEQLARALGGQQHGGVWTAPCEAIMPKVHFKLAGGATLTLNGDDLFHMKTVGSTGHCMLAFMSNGSMHLRVDADWVFGQRMLRKYCTKYDFTRKTIGFSVAKSTHY